MVCWGRGPLPFFLWWGGVALVDDKNAIFLFLLLLFNMLRMQKEIFCLGFKGINTVYWYWGQNKPTQIDALLLSCAAENAFARGWWPLQATSYKEHQWRWRFIYKPKRNLFDWVRSWWNFERKKGLLSPKNPTTIKRDRMGESPSRKSNPKQNIITKKLVLSYWIPRIPKDAFSCTYLDTFRSRNVVVMCKKCLYFLKYFQFLHKNWYIFWEK